MSLPRFFAAVALALSAATGAHAATGTGGVSFAFTSFDGPFAAAQTGFVGDPSKWLLTGEVNGRTPTVNGVTSPASSGFVYIGGDEALSGQSVTMAYANIPGLPSVISFTPVANFGRVSTGDPFKLGTLSFTNGQWVGGSGDPATNYPVTLHFRIATSSSTPQFNQVVDDAFTVVTNQAAGDCSTAQGQMDEADFIYLAGAPKLGSMRVYDQACKPAGATNSGSVELWGRFGSLDYVDFRNPTGSAFLVDSTGVGAIGVPEPAAWTILLAGFGLMGLSLRGRRGRRLAREVAGGRRCP
jgi:hypothetical protein